jgi:hypothetical protein
MTGVGWSLVEVAAQLLERDEREAVLGDLLETAETAWQDLLDILGLVIRRQASPWKDWRPWLAAFGVALPSSLLLMGVSVSVSCTYQRLTGPKFFDGCAATGQEGFLLLLCHVLLLIAWSWTCGFVVGSVSRRTLWVSAALCLFPCLFCLARFREASLSRLCLFLFLLPAILGVRHGLRSTRIKLGSAFVLAITVTVLMISAWSNGAMWILNWALLWPAWYLAATAWRPGRESRTGSWPRPLDQAS